MVLSLSKVRDLINVDDFVSNPGRTELDFPDIENSLGSKRLDSAFDEISSWPSYKATSLKSLSDVAQLCEIENVFYKDESERLGLGSFKALGGAYAVKKLAKAYAQKGAKIEDLVVSTASAGNHGRSVAWGAQEIGCSAKIFIHSGVSQSRADAMRKFGAEVIRVNGNYDEALEVCIKEAQKNSWELVSDTSWSGYEGIPMDIMAGYGVIMSEVLEQMNRDRPTHIFLPAGCGGLAAGLISSLWREMGKSLCHLVSVESAYSSCILESVKAQNPVFVNIERETVMVGLSCGEVSEQAWKILSQTLSHSISITDKGVAPLMKLFAEGKCGGGKIEAGECSTSGLASLLAISKNKDLRHKLGLNESSKVLLIGTEGATDPIAYNELIEKGSSVG